MTRRKDARTIAEWQARGGGLPPAHELARMAHEGDREAAALLLDWLRLDLLNGEGFRYLDSPHLRRFLAGCIESGRLQFHHPAKRPRYGDRERRADGREIVSPVLARVVTGQSKTAAAAELAGEGDERWTRSRLARSQGDFEELEGIVAARVEQKVRDGMTEESACTAVAATLPGATLKGVRSIYRRACRPGHVGHHWVRLVRDGKQAG